MTAAVYFHVRPPVETESKLASESYTVQIIFFTGDRTTGASTYRGGRGWFRLELKAAWSDTAARGGLAVLKRFDSSINIPIL